MMKKKITLAGADLREFGNDFANNMEKITEAQKNISMDLAVLAQDAAMIGDAMQGFELNGVSVNKEAASNLNVSSNGTIVATNVTNATANATVANHSDGNITVTKESLAHSITVLKGKLTNQTHNETHNATKMKEEQDDVVKALDQLKAAIYASRVSPKISDGDTIVVRKDAIDN